VTAYCLPTPLTGHGRYISRDMSRSFAYDEVEIALLNKGLEAPCVHVSRSLAPRRGLYRATSRPDPCLLPHLPFRAAYSFRWPLQLTSTASFLASQREHKCDPGHLVVHNLWGKKSKCLSTDMINAFWCSCRLSSVLSHTFITTSGSFEPLVPIPRALAVRCGFFECDIEVVSRKLRP
jgi:hypothetical protein